MNENKSELISSLLPEEKTPSAKFVPAAKDKLRTAEDFKALAEELTRSRKELEQFTSVASHDLQEPLVSAAGFIDLAQSRSKGKLDPQADEFLTLASQSMMRMRSLLQDLLAFSRTTSRAVPFETVQGDLVFKNAAEALADKIETSQAVITKNALPEILCDGKQISQVFQNLLANAIKFHSEEKPRIHVDCIKNESEWIFSVKDNGIGFEQKYAQEIFAPFRRLHAQKEYTGNGMGLGVCKKIIERHGGKIWADSTPGQGATFFFSLPLPPAELSDG